MKNIPALEDALSEDYAIRAVPEVIVDWNMNRYVGAVASNTPSEDTDGFDIEMFPIESIAEPLRPTKGINKARVGDATIGDDYLVGGNATPNGRFYIADEDDLYKYWTSPLPSNASTGALTNCAPQVIYGATTAVNKIVFTFENSWASPTTFSIQTTTAATPIEADWTEVANQTTVGTAWRGLGQIVLHWNGTAWVTTGRVDNADKSPITTNIRGVRIVVTALGGGYQVTGDGSTLASTFGSYVAGVFTTQNTTGRDAHFDLIEISARLEVDLSPYVIDIEDNFEMAESSDLYPIGTITSNQAGLSLSNIYTTPEGNTATGLFSAENLDSPYHNYIEENAEITLRYKYFDMDDVPLGTVQQFKMYTEMWSGQEEDTVNVDLTDHAKFFNEVVVRPAMWENLSVPEIVWRVLDSVGFVNYSIDRNPDSVTEHRIPVFYTDGEQNVWQILDDLAKASQTAIYFDAYGKLQVKTRDFAYSPDDAAVWNFTSVSDVTQLSNIVSIVMNTEFAPNHYKVIYQKTNWSAANFGIPAMQKVWEPEGTQVLRGNPLIRTLETTGNYLWLGADVARLWPYEGLVNIQGELIRYKGKQFVYYTGPTGSVRNVKDIESADEHRQRSNDTPQNYRHKNYYTGALRITERGVWNSENKRHPVDAEGYSVRHIVNGTRRTDVAGFRHLKTQSKVEINTPKRFGDYGDILFVTRGAADDTPFYHYGTKFRFVKSPGKTSQAVGFVIHNDGTANEDGYYIEIVPSRMLSGKERKSRHELIMYARVGGVTKRIGGQGAAVAIGENIDYELDISYKNVSSDHRVQVWINGKNVMNQTVTGSNRATPNGRFGFFARGKTRATFEYLYAVKREGEEPPDDFSFLDKVERGYTGNQWDREWVYQWRTRRRRVKKKWVKESYRWNQQFFDEFGPYVHELREYDVKFSPSPVLHSRLYNTNDWSAVCLEYKANPFGAKFIVANTARKNTVVHGDDTLSFAGTGQSVNQVLTVFGRALVVDEAQEEIVKNDEQIRRRGRIDAELSSTWIQSKSMAKDIAEWLSDNFSYGNENITVETFGNPLIEVGDVVNVNYPQKHIDGDFFVVGIRNRFNSGVTTSLDLRRRV